MAIKTVRSRREPTRRRSGGRSSPVAAPSPRDRTAAHLRRAGRALDGDGAARGADAGRGVSWYWPETSTAPASGASRPTSCPTHAGVRPPRPGPRRRAPPFPVAGGGHLIDAFSIVAQLCLALDHLHRHGLVHRDVKPANVFLGNDGRTTLLDFGLACAAAATRENEVGVGTMEYAAPEQICGGPVDRRADIYSLGCVLYELVTGGRRFEAIRPARSPSARSSASRSRHRSERRRSGPARRPGDVDARQDAGAPAGQRDGGRLAPGRTSRGACSRRERPAGRRLRLVPGGPPLQEGTDVDDVGSMMWWVAWSRRSSG